LRWSRLNETRTNDDGLGRVLREAVIFGRLPTKQELGTLAGDNLLAMHAGLTQAPGHHREKYRANHMIPVSKRLSRMHVASGK